MAGIDHLKEELQAAITVVNGVDKLRAVKFDVLVEQVLDLDEAEAVELATAVGILDLADDALEAKVEALALAGAKPVAFALRILKLLLPKKG